MPCSGCVVLTTGPTESPTWFWFLIQTVEVGDFPGGASGKESA